MYVWGPCESPASFPFPSPPGFWLWMCAALASTAILQLLTSGVELQPCPGLPTLLRRFSLGASVAFPASGLSLDIDVFGLESVLINDLALASSWQVRAAWRWKKVAHINVLETEAYLRLCFLKARHCQPGGGSFWVFFMVFRSADARVSQSVKQLVSQLVDSRPSGQSVGEPTERSVSQSVSQSVSRSANRAASQSVSQSVSGQR